METYCQLIKEMKAEMKFKSAVDADRHLANEYDCILNTGVVEKHLEPFIMEIFDNKKLMNNPAIALAASRLYQVFKKYSKNHIDVKPLLSETVRHYYHR